MAGAGDGSMRLTPDEIAAIKDTAAEIFGAAAVVRLFGSRIDDTKRGGDIDLHIVVAPEQEDFRLKQAFVVGLWARIGEQRIDVLLEGRGRAARPIEVIARRDGVVL